MLHQPLLSVCPEAACNESTLSSPSSAPIWSQETKKSQLSVSFLHRIRSIDTEEPQISSAVRFVRLATALAASTASCMSIHVCGECRASEPWLYSSLLAGAHQHSLIQISYNIWHHQNESTSLNVSITIFSVSVALFRASLYLYLFFSAVLCVSPTARLLYLWVIFTPYFPSLPCRLLPPLPSSCLPSLYLWQNAVRSMWVVVTFGQNCHNTTHGRGGVLLTACTQNNNCSAQPPSFLSTFLASVRSCAASHNSLTLSPWKRSQPACCSLCTDVVIV